MTDNRPVPQGDVDDQISHIEEENYQSGYYEGGEKILNTDRDNLNTERGLLKTEETKPVHGLKEKTITPLDKMSQKSCKNLPKYCNSRSYHLA